MLLPFLSGGISLFPSDKQCYTSNAPACPAKWKQKVVKSCKPVRLFRLAFWGRRVYKFLNTFIISKGGQP